MRRVDVAYVLIYDDKSEKILVVKNRRGDSFDYTLPGGAVEAGETLYLAAVREVKEETGYDVEIEGIVNVSEGFFEKKGHHSIFFTFKGHVTGGEKEITRPDEILDVQWVDIQTADQLLEPTKLKVSKILHRSFPYIYRGYIK